MMESEETRQWERHVAANNHRLVTITQNVGDVNSFETGCRELIQWCNDPRAFTAHFEANLLTALQAVVDNASKEGFSGDLAAELVALCHQHRRHLSKIASTRIGRWHEQFRRQKRSAKKKQKKGEENQIDPHGYVEEPYLLVEPGLRQQAQQQPAQAPSGGVVTVVTMWDGTMAQPMPSPSYPTYPPQYAMGMRSMGYPTMEGYDPSMMYPGQPHPGMMMAHPGMVPPHPGMVPRPMIHPSGFDPTQFPHGIPPSATNRLPGQVRPMPPYAMMPGYPAYGYPSHPAQVIRAGPPIPYGQMSGGGQQPVAAFPNPNASTGVDLNQRFPDHTPIYIVTKHVMQIFQLDHDKESCTLPFQLTADILQQLSKPEYELQLKCFNKDDKQMTSKWPISQKTNYLQLSVRINGQSVPIINLNQSLLIKKFVNSNENSLELTVNECVCSHRFIMSVVRIQQVGEFLSSMVKESLLKPENSIETSQRKLLHWAQMTRMNTLALADPRCKTRFSLPIRGKGCAHPPVLDLRMLLCCYPDASFFECPYCKTLFAHSEIDVDHYLLRLIANTPETVREVMCCQDGQWRAPGEPPVAVGTNSRKRDNNAGKAGTMKRFKTESSLDTPNLGQGSPMSKAPSSVPCTSTHPASLPSMGQFIGQSPAPMTMPHSVPDMKPDLMSPYHQNTSPIKMVVLPSGPLAAGPPTPSTPGHPTTSTSPHQVQTQSHGSVETASLAGSAPYTPAPTSVGSSSLGHSVPGTSITAMDSQTTLPNHTILPIDDFDQHLDGLFSTNDVMSAADLQRYLRDIDPSLGSRNKDTLSNLPTDEELSADLDDVVQIIAADML